MIKNKKIVALIAITSVAVLSGIGYAIDKAITKNNTQETMQTLKTQSSVELNDAENDANVSDNEKVNTNTDANNDTQKSVTTKTETSSKNVKATSSPTSSSSKIENTATKTQAKSNKDLALQAFNSVLQNKSKFYNPENKTNVYLKDFLANNGGFDCVFNATSFTIVDMDGDNIPEVVIELTAGKNTFADFYEVLHYENGKVYGYLFGVRSLGDIKTDGTFSYSSGASDNGFSKLSFKASTFSVSSIGYEEPTTDGTGELFYINNKKVTEASYKSFIKEQQAKKDTIWYDFSQKNIDSQLSSK